MKKILFLLLSTVAMYGQVPADATPLENIQITNNTQSTTATKVNVQEANGTINTISKSDLVNVVEVNDVPSLPLVGEVGKIYVVKNVNKIYRWNGTFYQELAGTDISGLQAQIDLKANDSDVIHKTGDTFLNSTDFDPLLSQNSDTIIRKRDLKPESSRFDPTLAPIYAWGDSMTDGFSTTNYPTQLTALFGYTVTNKGVGGENSTQVKNRLVADVANYSKSVIIWVGRNNLVNITTTKADIATMISTIGHTRYLVVGVVNATNEPIGSTNYNIIVSLNNDLKAIYGNKFVAIREQLVSKYDPLIPQDVIDHSNDCPPTSLHLSADPLHLNTAGQTVVSEFFNQRLGNMFDLNGYLQSKDLKYYIKNSTDVLHKTTNEAFTGIKYSENTGSTFINGLNLVNSGTGSSQVMGLSVTSTGRGQNIDISGAGYGHYITNRVGGVASYYRNLLGGQAIGGANFGTGTFASIDSQSGSTGNLLLLSKNNVPTTIIDHNGVISTPPPIISGTPATSVGSYDLLTRNIVNGQIEKILNTSVATSTSVALKADLASPSLTGTPTAPTATEGTNTTQIATTAFVQAGLNLKSNLSDITLQRAYDTSTDKKIQTLAIGPFTLKAQTAAASDNVFVIENSSGFRVASVGAQGSLRAISASVDGSVTATSFNGSATLTGMPTAPTAIAGTNTTQIATTAFVQANSRPYKVYTALLSQTGTNAPVTTVLENTLGGTVVWTRNSTGLYNGTLTGIFTASKTVFFINQGSGASRLSGHRPDTNTVQVVSMNAYLNELVDNSINNASIEIRVYN